MPNLSVANQGGPVRASGARPPARCGQPLAEGGGDQGPTPTELFVASLAACVAFYTRRLLARHDLASGGLRVDADFTMSTDRPARVDTITPRLIISQPLAPHRRRALLAVVDHCTVHNSIRTPPHVHPTLTEPADAGVGAHRSLGLGG